MTHPTQVQHTPGPFEAIKGAEKGDDLRCAVAAVRGDYRYLVATIENGAPGDICDTEWANAQLFAAAPELLEALEEAIEWDGHDSEGVPAVWLNKARAAIAKARGAA